MHERLPWASKRARWHGLGWHHPHLLSRLQLRQSGYLQRWSAPMTASTPTDAEPGVTGWHFIRFARTHGRSCAPVTVSNLPHFKSAVHCPNPPLSLPRRRAVRAQAIGGRHEFKKHRDQQTKLQSGKRRHALALPKAAPLFSHCTPAGASLLYLLSHKSTHRAP